MVKIEVTKKDLVWMVPLIGVLFLAVAVAVGGTDYTVMGHSAGEIQGFNATVNDGVSWDEVSAKPAGFNDDVDNVRVRNTPLYKRNGLCAGEMDEVITATQCNTAVCGATLAGIECYSACDGGCTTGSSFSKRCIFLSPTACSNTLIGHTVN